MSTISCIICDVVSASVENLKKCSSCQEKMCIECSVNEENFCKCFHCERQICWGCLSDCSLGMHSGVYCPDCIEHCYECYESYCKDCLTQCQKCQNYACEDHVSGSRCTDCYSK